MSRLELAEDVDLRLDAVAELVACLEAEGLVHQVARRGSDAGVTLALAPERIPLARLLEIATRATLGRASAERPRLGRAAGDPRERARRRRRADARRGGPLHRLRARVSRVWPSAYASTR